MGMQLEQLDLGFDLLPSPGHPPTVDRRLTVWAAHRERPRRRCAGRGQSESTLRFALYGRVSTVEFQDAESSLGWQRASASEVIAGRGRIVAEFFDVGCSRRAPWARRPPAARLLEAVTHPERGFDAIIVGESERAFAGTQLLRLAPDPTTAPHVKRIFAQRLTGRSITGIARDLNNQGVPCPSGADPDRNPHRDHHTWTATTVASILANPRYTGRQVWNRQRTDHHHVDGEQIRVQHWNPTDQWVISTRPAHPELVSQADYTAAQTVRSSRTAGDGTQRTYRLAGLVQCGICGRRLDSHWVNNRPGYRCRHGRTSTTPTNHRTAPDPYGHVREDELLQHIAALRRGNGRPPAPTEIPRLLRDQELAIICDHTQGSLRRAPATHGPAPAVG
jgi:site-specific DNA recombinase